MDIVYFTFRLLAFHITYCISGFLATGVASGRLTHGVTNSRTFGVITLPSTLRVTLGIVCTVAAENHCYE